MVRWSATTLAVSERDGAALCSAVEGRREILQIQRFGNTGLTTCTGSLQMWSVPVPVSIGEAFKHGQASSVSSAFDSTDGTFVQVDQNLKLGN